MKFTPIAIKKVNILKEKGGVVIDETDELVQIQVRNDMATVDIHGRVTWKIGSNTK